MKIIHNINKQGLNLKKEIYQCHTCNKLFNWVKGESCWFGSYKQMDDNPESVKYFCGEKCSRIIK